MDSREFVHDYHGLQRMTLVILTFTVVSPAGQNIHFISELAGTKFFTDILGDQTMSSADFGDLLTFPVAPL